jgi:hypothetical protein
MGAAQLLFKAYLRTYKVKGYRTLIGAGGALTEKFMQSMDLMRLMQSNEGMTVIDAEDEFETQTYSFAGLPEALNMLGQQISGALGIPLTRLFGQSPTGMDATGEGDLRNYYDLVKATQEARLRRPLKKIFEVLWHSTLGGEPPDTFNFQFNSLRQLDELEKAELAERDAGTIVSLHGAGIISTTIALKELKQSSILTGRFTNITEEDIKASEDMPAPWSPEAQEQAQQASMMGGDPNDPNADPGGGPNAPPGGGGPPANPPGPAGGPPKPPGAGMPGAGVPAPKSAESREKVDA